MSVYVTLSLTRYETQKTSFLVKTTNSLVINNSIKQSVAEIKQIFCVYIFYDTFCEFSIKPQVVGTQKDIIMALLMITTSWFFYSIIEKLAKLQNIYIT